MDWQFLHNSAPWYPNWQHKHTPPNKYWRLFTLGFDSAVFENDNVVVRVLLGCRWSSRDWNGASPMVSSKSMSLFSSSPCCCWWWWWSCRWSSSVVVPLLVQLDLASWSSTWWVRVTLSVLGWISFGVAHNMVVVLLMRLISATGRAGGEAFLKSKWEETTAVSLRGRWVWGSRPRLMSLRLMWVFQ